MWKESAERRHLLQEIEEFNNEFPVGGSHVEKFRQSRKSVQAKGLYVPIFYVHQQKMNTKKNCSGSKSPYTLSVPMQIQLCLSRGFQRLRGDMSLFFTSVLGNFFFSLIISSIFYNLPADTSSFYSRGALLFYAILMNAFSSVLEVCIMFFIISVIILTG